MNLNTMYTKHAKVFLLFFFVTFVSACPRALGVVVKNANIKHKIPHH